MNTHRSTDGDGANSEHKTGMRVIVASSDCVLRSVDTKRDFGYFQLSEQHAGAMD